MLSLENHTHPSGPGLLYVQPLPGLEQGSHPVFLGAAADVNSQIIPFSLAPRKLGKLYHCPSWTLRSQGSLQAGVTFQNIVA